jgi:hypothetical protein
MASHSFLDREMLSWSDLAFSKHSMLIPKQIQNSPSCPALPLKNGFEPLTMGLFLPLY